jgi:hypothetical protein
VPYYE